MGRRTGIAVVVIGLSCGGCVDNAVLELTVTLPVRPTAMEGALCMSDADCPTPGIVCGEEGTCAARAFVLIQPRKAADNPFGDDWRGNDLDPVELSDEGPTVDEISVLTEDVDADLNIKVSFCTTPTCTAFADDPPPSLWYQLQHPFYRGKRTFHDIEIATIPEMRDTEADIVQMCDIRGCVDGELAMYCRTDGRHLCE
jgi:hypothetical protein